MTALLNQEGSAENGVIVILRTTAVIVIALHTYLQ
jgi:hypothetical protein